MLKFLGPSILALIMHVSLFPDYSQGEMLEKQMWQEMKEKNWSGVEKKMASYFQSVHPDGARNKEQELILIKGLDLGSYTISDMNVTEGPGTLIVTYKISVGETIDSDRLSTKPASRLSVWQNNDGTWQWVSHANLNPL